MNGYTSKYLFYKSNKQSIITIPLGIAKSLNWNHKDDINMVYEVINGMKGVFLYKKDQDIHIKPEVQPMVNTILNNNEHYDKDETIILEILKNNDENGLTHEQIYDFFKLKVGHSSNNNLSNVIKTLLEKMVKDFKIIKYKDEKGKTIYCTTLF